MFWLFSILRKKENSQSLGMIHSKIQLMSMVSNNIIDKAVKITVKPEEN